uniref:Uncharacterized protein n=1 Tax=Myotis myotis TaxID=51298 RepID=A0A7J8AMQ4_MYOMY|nr:hypothetical protein mMyoMyo1_008113 [Myotis myotis]
MRLQSAGGSTGLEGPKWLQSHGWQLVLAGTWGISVLQVASLFQEAIRAVFHGSPGAVFLEGENKLEGLLKPAPWNLYTIISTTFWGSEKPQSQPRFKGVDKQVPPLAGKSGKTTLQRRKGGWGE